MVNMYDDERPPTRSERRRKLIASIVAIIAVLALVVMSVAPAFALGEEQRFNHYWVDATAHSDGSIDVEIDLEFEFGSEESHGVYLTYLTRQRIEGDPDHYRVLEYTDIEASSPTAPDDLRVETDDDGLGIYVGDEDVEITGTHAYTINFTVRGVVNSGAGEAGEDEIYWNIIGTGYEQHIDDVRVTLRGPAAPVASACWYGDFGSDATCTGIEGHAHTAIFTQTFLMPGEGLTIATAYEGGTFNDVRPMLEERATFTSVMGGPAIAVAAGILTLLAVILVPLGLSRLRRDEQYAGITPGLFPGAGGAAPLTRAPLKTDAAVRFTPPEGLMPAEVGRIVTEANKSEFNAATLVDLAARGYLHITSAPGEGGKEGWVLTRITGEVDGLREYERALIEALFKEDPNVRLEDLPEDRRKDIAELTSAQGAMMVREGWFTADPGGAKRSVALLGGTLLGGGFLAAILAALAGVGLLGVPILAAAITLMFSTSRAPQRTAKGYAYYVQAMGFKKYLETAEAGQLQFEAGEDIFSRYLPYAMVFGIVERWVALFEELAAQGRWTTVPTWYTGGFAGGAFFSSTQAAAFASSLAGLQAAANLAAMSGATPGTSGGSGFSGGGFSGGGVGGGGGGSW